MIASLAMSASMGVDLDTKLYDLILVTQYTRREVFESLLLVYALLLLVIEFLVLCEREVDTLGGRFFKRAFWRRRFGR